MSHMIKKITDEFEDSSLMNPVLECIYARKSVRHFTEQPVESEKLELVLKAATHAPSGRNLQTWQFTVLQNHEKIQALKVFIAQVLEDTNEGYMFGFNNPDKLIIVSGLKSNHNTIRDCSCAIENMLLAAHSLGLGACWINSLRNIYDHPAIIGKLAEFGIPEDHMAVGMVVLGYPAREPKTLERKENAIHFVD